MHHISLEFCSYIVSLHRGYSDPLGRYRAISWMEYRCHTVGYDFSHPCVRVIFPKPTNCGTISQTPNTSSVFDLVHC